MSSKLVSVIIPTYNRAHCLIPTIQSALVQSYQPIEVLVIDDGSNDNTGDLIREHFQSDFRVRYVYQENARVCAARNHGLRLAQGDLIAFLDSDDLWKPWKLEVQIACLDHLPEAGMIWSDMEAIGPDGRLINSAYLRTMYSSYLRFDGDKLFTNKTPLADVIPQRKDLAGNRLLWWGNIFSQMTTGNLVHTSTVLARRDRIEQVGAFNPDLDFAGEDYEYYLRICREGPVAYCDLSTIVYQVGLPDQLTRYKRKLAENFLKTISATLQQDRERINLAEDLLHEVQAEAFSWAGYEAFQEGDHKSARGYFCRSLQFKPWQPQVATWLALACMPAPVVKRLRQFRRGLCG